MNRKGIIFMLMELLVEKKFGEFDSFMEKKILLFSHGKCQPTKDKAEVTDWSLGSHGHIGIPRFFFAVLDELNDTRFLFFLTLFYFHGFTYLKALGKVVLDSVLSKNSNILSILRSLLSLITRLYTLT